MASFNFNRGKHGNVLPQRGSKNSVANNGEESDFTRYIEDNGRNRPPPESEDTAVRGGKARQRPVVGSENDDGGGNGRERNKGWERRMGFVAGEVSVGSLKPLIAF